LDHTYSKDSSRRRGKCVQRLFKIGYEMWLCVRYRQTNKLSVLYIRFQLYRYSHLWHLHCCINCTTYCKHLRSQNAL
jgi:hypothetical protein